MPDVRQVAQTVQSLDCMCLGRPLEGVRERDLHIYV